MKNDVVWKWLRFVLEKKVEIGFHGKQPFRHALENHKEEYSSVINKASSWIVIFYRLSTNTHRKYSLMYGWLTLSTLIQF